MGVYYEAGIAWGLLIPNTYELRGHDLQDVYDLPSDFMYTMGGDLMSGVNEAYVLHPNRAYLAVLDTIGHREKGFGVYLLRDIYTPTDEEYQVLCRFADENKLEHSIGWFAISSVG